ncbi:MAG: hypothetical protein QXO86_01305 [Nitrososphaerota archaeon]
MPEQNKHEEEELEQAHRAEEDVDYYEEEEAGSEGSASPGGGAGSEGGEGHTDRGTGAPQQDWLTFAFNYYRAQGYTDEQIIRGLAKILEQRQGAQEEEKPPEHLTYEEELEWKLNKKLSALEKQLQDLQMQQVARENINYNNSVIYEVLREYGYEKLSAEQERQLVALFREIYPTLDTMRDRLTRRQVEVVVREFQSSSQGKRGNQKTAAEVRAPQGVRHIPQQGSERLESGPTPWSTRKRRWDEL